MMNSETMSTSEQERQVDLHKLQQQDESTMTLDSASTLVSLEHIKTVANKHDLTPSDEKTPSLNEKLNVEDTLLQNRVVSTSLFTTPQGRLSWPLLVQLLTKEGSSLSASYGRSISAHHDHDSCSPYLELLLLSPPCLSLIGKDAASKPLLDQQIASAALDVKNNAAVTKASSDLSGFKYPGLNHCTILTCMNHVFSHITTLQEPFEYQFVKSMISWILHCMLDDHVRIASAVFETNVPVTGSAGDAVTTPSPAETADVIFLSLSGLHTLLGIVLVSPKKDNPCFLPWPKSLSSLISTTTQYYLSTLPRLFHLLSSHHKFHVFSDKMTASIHDKILECLILLSDLCSQCSSEVKSDFIADLSNIGIISQVVQDLASFPASQSSRGELSLKLLVTLFSGIDRLTMEDICSSLGSHKVNSLLSYWNKFPLLCSQLYITMMPWLLDHPDMSACCSNLESHVIASLNFTPQSAIETEFLINNLRIIKLLAVNFGDILTHFIENLKSSPGYSWADLNPNVILNMCPIISLCPADQVISFLSKNPSFILTLRKTLSHVLHLMQTDPFVLVQLTGLFRLLCRLTHGQERADIACDVFLNLHVILTFGKLIAMSAGPEAFDAISAIVSFALISINRSSLTLKETGGRLTFSPRITSRVHGLLAPAELSYWSDPAQGNVAPEHLQHFIKNCLALLYELEFYDHVALLKKSDCGLMLIEACLAEQGHFLLHLLKYLPDATSTHLLVGLWAHCTLQNHDAWMTGFLDDLGAQSKVVQVKFWSTCLQHGRNRLQGLWMLYCFAARGMLSGILKPQLTMIRRAIISDPQGLLDLVQDPVEGALCCRLYPLLGIQTPSIQ